MLGLLGLTMDSAEIAARLSPGVQTVKMCVAAIPAELLGAQSVARPSSYSRGMA